MNGIHIKLAGDARLGLVFAKAEHPQPRNQHHGGAGVAYRRRIGLGKRPIVVTILVEILGERAIDLRLQRLNAIVGAPVHKHGPDLGADEVIGTTGSQKGQSLAVRGVNKLQHVGRVRIAADKPLPGADAPTQKRCDLDRNFAAICARRKRLASEPRRSLRLPVTLDELANAIDHVQRVQIALALRLAPGKEPVPAQHDSVAARILLDDPLHHHRQLEAGTLPWQPHQRVAKLAIELFHLRFAVGTGRERDRPIGMQVIDVRKGQKSVQRRVNGRGDWIVAEGAQRIHLRHLIFEFHAFVDALQRQKLFLVKRGEPGALDAAKVAARTLHPQHFYRIAGQRVELDNLGTRVSTGKVGDAQI